MVVLLSFIRVLGEEAYRIYNTRCKRYVDKYPFSCENIGQDEEESPSRRIAVSKQQREVDMFLKKGIVIGIVAIVLFGIVGSPPVVWAQATYTQQMDKPSGTEITFDFFIARPLGLVSLAMGTTFFIVSFPLAVITGSTKDTASTLVGEPFNFTFVRGLGEY